MHTISMITFSQYSKSLSMSILKIDNRQSNSQQDGCYVTTSSGDAPQLTRCDAASLGYIYSYEHSCSENTTRTSCVHLVYLSMNSKSQRYLYTVASKWVVIITVKIIIY